MMRADVALPPDSLELLGAADQGQLLEPLRALPMNTLFARAVLQKDAPGQVYAYPTRSPRVGYVIHGYGMSLLFGDAGDPAISRRLLRQVLARPRVADEWLQVAPDTWADELTALAADLSGQIERYTRVNFQFSAAEYQQRRQRLLDPGNLPGHLPGYQIVPVDRALFDMPGSVVPSAFFRDAEQFLRIGTGFAVLIDGEPAALAFSSFALDAQLELGIETRAAHRGRGLATLACAALIDHCLARGLEPIWACRLENTASYRLAQALGFEPVRRLPYFRLRPVTPGDQPP